MEELQLVYLEGLLNAKYQWLPQNNGWIMSGEVYNFANNGANKVMELMALVDDNLFDFSGIGITYNYPWFSYTNDNGASMEGTHLSPEMLVKGIIIDKDSPIWDAVKGVE